MLFNSIEYLIFLPLVFLSYWALRRNLRWQNIFLLLASYLFYGWWDWRFLSLIILSSTVDYVVGLQLSRTGKKGKRRRLLGLSLLVNLGLLGVFKYYHFFVDSFIDAFSILGVHLNVSTLKIILPVGISFYTFQTLSYTIDIYRRKMEATADFVAFFAYVSFFPQLVAGPIERAANLLPQFFQNRRFNYDLAADGMRQILWGFFKKMAVADNCAAIVDSVFNAYPDYNGMTLFVASVLFSFQIYCDFSGYSDIAIGTAKLFGFRLMQNFSVPYFSRDIAEFWRRWHISLTTWFRDYLYIPLGGSRGGRWQTVRNVFIIFLVSGFWHGANWTFIFWGLINALLFLPLLIGGQNRRNLGTVAEGRNWPSIRQFMRIGLNFLLVNFAWIFFRADHIDEAFEFIGGIFTPGFFALPDFRRDLAIVAPLIVILLIIEWVNRTKAHQLDIAGIPKWRRHIMYILIIALIFFFGKYNAATFIYFQF